MNKLEEAARKHAGITPDVMDVKNLRDLRTISARKSLQRYDSFAKGAEWQKNNMWIPVEEELPDVDKQCFVITKNGKCSVSNMYIPKDCCGNVLGEKEWKGSLSFKESIVSWMPIPEIKEGE